MLFFSLVYWESFTTTTADDSCILFSVIFLTLNTHSYKRKTHCDASAAFAMSR